MGAVERYVIDSGERRYRARWDLPAGPGGKRRQRVKRGFQTKKEAEKFLRKTLAEQDRGHLSVRTDMTVAAAAEEWLALKAAQGKRPTSLDNWRTSLETHVIPRLGERKVTDVRPGDVERLYLDVSQHGKRAGRCRTAGVTCRDHGCAPDRHDGLAPKTVQHVHGALRAVLTRAVANGLLAVNPCDAPQVREALPRRTTDGRRVSPEDYWTDEQARAFLTDTEGHHLHALWALLLATGLRRAEAAALQWADVDLDAGTLRVRRTTTSVRGEAVTNETGGKTDAAARTVPLGPSTVAILREHRREQAAERLAAETWGDVDGHVFTDEGGESVHPARMTKRFTAASDRAGLPRVGLHGCRHYAATQMLRRGVPVPTVARVLGHEDPAITWATYAHAIPQDDSLAARAMEQALHGDA